MKFVTSAATAAIALLGVAVGAPANALVIHYTSHMTQANEVPPSSPNTGATGDATWTYDDQGDGFGANDVLSWNITYTQGLFPNAAGGPGDPSSIHLHFGHSGINGDIIVDIPSHSSTPANGLSPPPVIGFVVLSDLIVGIHGLANPPLLCGGVPAGANALYDQAAIRSNFLCADGTNTVLDPTDPANDGAAVNLYVNLHTSQTELGFVRDQLHLVVDVPEPATLTLFGMGLLGLAGLRRRLSA